MKTTSLVAHIKWSWVRFPAETQTFSLCDSHCLAEFCDFPSFSDRFFFFFFFGFVRILATSMISVVVGLYCQITKNGIVGKGITLKKFLQFLGKNHLPEQIDYSEYHDGKDK